MKNSKLAPAICVLVLAIVAPTGTLAQELGLTWEMTVGKTGRTVFRCFAANDLQSEVIDCSGNARQVKCDGEAMVVDRTNTSGTCFIGKGTDLDNVTLDQAQQEISPILRSAK